MKKIAECIRTVSQNIFLILDIFWQDKSVQTMLLGKKLRELREERGMLQRQVAALLEIDGGLYSKIERGERKAKRGQITSLAKIFNVCEDEILTLWLADQIEEAVGDEKKIIAREAIDTFCSCKLMLDK